LPLTPNGKLDRQALPAPDERAIAHQAYEAPQGELEEAVGAICQELLGLPRVGRQDHFFELGGHSLTAVLLVGRLHDLCHVELALKDLFQNPTLAALAARVASLQFQTYLGADEGALMTELDAMSESELMALLAEEEATQ
jgi:acyl carrier protein